jgi:hypothetical protein
MNNEWKINFVGRFLLLDFKSQFYQTLTSSYFHFPLLSLAILKYRKYLVMPQMLKLNNKKWKKIFVLGRKSLVGLTRVFLIQGSLLPKYIGGNFTHQLLSLTSTL